MIKKKYKNKGFTFIELVIVISILSILTAIVIPRFSSYTEKAKEQVCNTNCSELDRTYHVYLVVEDIDHTEVLFQEYLKKHGKDICPKDGSISYEAGRIRCNIHSNDIEDGEEVPWL